MRNIIAFWPLLQSARWTSRQGPKANRFRFVALFHIQIQAKSFPFLTQQFIYLLLQLFQDHIGFPSLVNSAQLVHVGAIWTPQTNSRLQPRTEENLFTHIYWFDLINKYLVIFSGISRAGRRWMYCWQWLVVIRQLQLHAPYHPHVEDVLLEGWHHHIYMIHLCTKICSFMGNLVWSCLDKIFVLESWLPWLRTFATTVAGWCHPLAVGKHITI